MKHKQVLKIQILKKGAIEAYSCATELFIQEHSWTFYFSNNFLGFDVFPLTTVDRGEMVFSLSPLLTVVRWYSVSQHCWPSWDGILSLSPLLTDVRWYSLSHHWWPSWDVILSLTTVDRREMVFSLPPLLTSVRWYTLSLTTVDLREMVFSLSPLLTVLIWYYLSPLLTVVRWHSLNTVDCCEMVFSLLTVVRWYSHDCATTTVALSQMNRCTNRLSGTVINI